MKPKIILITNDFPPLSGGIANFLHNICALLDTDILVETIDAPGAAIFDATQTYPINRSIINSKPQSFRSFILARTWLYHCRKYIDETNSPIFLGGYGSRIILLTLSYLKIRYQVRTSVIVHGGDIRSLTMEKGLGFHFVRKLMKYVDHFIANSEFTAKLVQTQFMIPKERISILNPGVRIKQINELTGTYKIDGINNLANNNTILSVGRLVEHKGIDNVLRALALLINQGLYANYIIIGDGPDRDRLEELAVSLKISDYAHFLGFVPDELLDSYYQQSTLFIMPSRATQDGSIEGFGIVFLEAAAHGIPTIGGNIGGISDAIVDGRTGLLVDPYSVEDIAVAIKRIFTDRELAKSLGQLARIRVHERFDWKTRSDEVRQVLLKSHL